MSDEGPLSGTKVLEISVYVQGPMAGLTLASLGAEVIKLERVGHKDHMRRFAGAFGVQYDELGKTFQYASLNRGKKSVVLDISSDAGRPVFERVVREADVFVTNLRESWLRANGADYEALRGVNPALVYGRGGGFGFRGEIAGDPCQDTVGMAYAGFMDVLSNDGVPNYPPGSMSDVLTGTNLASAIMAGLLRRSASGKGSLVGTTQVQSLMWMQSQSAGLAATTGQRMRRFDPDRPSNPLFNVYRSADGWIAIAAIHPHQWPPIAEILGLADSMQDERFADFAAILRNPAEATALLRGAFAARTTDEWWQALRAAGVWTAPVNSLEELSRDAGIRDNEYLVEFPDCSVGPPTPFDVGDWRGPRPIAAEYSEHTGEVLAALGYSATQIATLRADGAIG